MATMGGRLADSSDGTVWAGGDAGLADARRRRGGQRRFHRPGDAVYRCGGSFARVVSAVSCRIPSLRPDGGSSECAHRNARGCRSGPVRERGPGRPMAGATASLSRQSYAQGRGRRNRTFHKGAWALTQAACSRSSLSAAQWRVGKGEIAVERRSRGRTSDSRARRRICDAEYFCDTNLACRRGRSCPNRVKRGCGRQAEGTAGLPPAPEIPVRSGTCASCHLQTIGVSEKPPSRKPQRYAAQLPDESD
jgi:hypothetical protein